MHKKYEQSQRETSRNVFRNKKTCQGTRKHAREQKTGQGKQNHAREEQTHARETKNMPGKKMSRNGKKAGGSKWLEVARSVARSGSKWLEVWLDVRKATEQKNMPGNKTTCRGTKKHAREQKKMPGKKMLMNQTKHVSCCSNIHKMNE